MSEKYDEYLKQHRDNVYNAFIWLVNNTPDIFDRGDQNDTNEFKALVEHHVRYDHDKSKWSDKEYDQYDNYFYGNKSYETVNDFNLAWLHHIHNNPHHWQYWVLINDDPDKGELVLDMFDDYIIEMICDWMSFSMKVGDLNELFKWYKEHSQYMKLSDYTRIRVDDILQRIKEEVEKGNNINNEE